MTTNEVAEKYSVARITVIKWCQQNGINRKLGATGIMEYDLTDQDIVNFTNRRTKGRPFIENPKRPRKQKKAD
jgi:hypothetical protein